MLKRAFQAAYRAFLAASKEAFAVFRDGLLVDTFPRFATPGLHSLRLPPFAHWPRIQAGVQRALVRWICPNFERVLSRLQRGDYASAMARFHLFEFHDSPRCPRLWRDSLTAFLRTTIDVLGIYDVIVPRLAALMARSGTDQIVDLCSGGGGPWARLSGALEDLVDGPVRVSLTDKQPNLEAFGRAHTASEGRIGFVESSVDATNVPAHLVGVRTLFTSFHHFRPDTAREILNDAVRNRVPIGVFEFTDRTFLSCLAMLFSPVIALVVVPFLAPFSWRRLFSCLPVPLLPLVIAWDGFVSNLRTYTVAELDALIPEVEGADYHWESGKISQGPIIPPVTYLMGWPIEVDRSAPTGDA